MKRLTLLFFFVLTLLNGHAQGWPSKYQGVMLQGFYWDSYGDTQWSNLSNQADELSKYFSAIWVPQSGYCNTTSNQMGYAPVWWFNHTSAFGSENDLRSMIKTFKEKNVDIIEDVVINHRNGNTNWCDFPEETWKNQTTHWTLADICAHDDNGKTAKAGFITTGAADTGDDFDGARDLDHTSDNVRKNIKLYLHFLKEDLQYAGFRYDMVKGFSAKYVGEYNSDAKPKYSVGEYWDGDPYKLKTWINGTKVNGQIQSAAFDFALKYYINDAIGKEQWERLNEDCPAKDPNYSRYAVTFVDNHDTDRDGNRLQRNHLAANAYILAMPGTPCIFLSHWKLYKTQIKKLILARKAAGITNESKILKSEKKGNGYAVIVEGDKGKVLLTLGNVYGYQEDGYKLALSDGNFKFYVSNEVDLTELDKVKEETSTTFTPPTFCKVNEGETCAFFEAPTTWNAQVYCWKWDNQANYTGGIWPGVVCDQVGTTQDGKKVYKWTWNNTKSLQSSTNSGIIFNNGNGQAQTSDLKFVNGGYYDNFSGSAPKAIIKVSTGISSIHADKQDNEWYTITGIKLNKPQKKGVYIYNRKKVLFN